MLKNKTLLITGGTGSFGNALINKFISSDIREIRVLSRDEKKQDDMRKYYNNPKLKFYIGDIRDLNSIEPAVKGSDYIFHAAALKQVPSCEFYPMEAIKTNLLGTENLLNSAIQNSVKKVVCLSTDKAVYPINAMGMSKGLMEKVSIAKSRISSNTIINVTRYGNVMCSRGSVIPLFADQIRLKQKVTITDPNMTRFMMSLDDAIDLVLYAYREGAQGEIFVQKAPAATIGILTKALSDLFGQPDYPSQVIGTRHGEKLFETLLSREEMSAAEDLGDYYRISPDLRDLNYSVFMEQGKKTISDALDYNSHNTRQLDLRGMQKLLIKLPFIKEIIRDQSVETGVHQVDVT